MDGWPTKSLLIARVHLLRTRRALRSRLDLAVLVLPVVVAVVAVVGRLPLPGYDALWPNPGAYAYGDALASGTEVPALESARGLAGLLFVLAVWTVGMREFRAGDLVSTDVDLHLRSLPSRTVVVGELLKHAAFASHLAGPVVAAGALAFGLGSASPSAAALVLLAGAATIATAVAVAVPAALGAKLAFLRWEPLRERARLLGAVLALGFAFLLVGSRSALAALGASPLGWYADLGLLTAGAGASTARAAAVAAATPAALVSSALVSARVGERLWLADPPRPSGSVSSGVREPSRIERELERVGSRPAAAVARTTWLRTVRRPETYLYAAMFVPIAASVAVAVGGGRSAAVPVSVAIYAAAIVAMGPTLDPIGIAGVGLALVRSTPRGGRDLLVGSAAAVALPGVVLVGGATAVAGLAVGAPRSFLAGAVAVAAVLAVTIPVVSLAVGVALPGAEGVRLRERSVRTPRFEAVTLLVLVTAALGLPALLGVYAADLEAIPPGVPEVAVSWGGLAATAAAATVAAARSFRYARRGIREFDPAE